MRSSLTFPHCPKPPSLVEASLPGQGAHQQIRVGGGGGNNGGGLDQTGFPAQVSPLNPPEPEPSLSPLSHRSVGGRPQTPLLPTPPPGFYPPPPSYSLNSFSQEGGAQPWEKEQERARERESGAKCP